MESKRKILLIGPMPPPAGGVSVHLFRLLEKSTHYPHLELAVFDLKKRKLFGADGKTKGLFAAVLFFLRSGILHIHLSHPVKVTIAKIGMFFGKKIIYTQHNAREVDFPESKKIIKLAHQVIYVFGDENNSQVIPAYIPSRDNRPLPSNLNDMLKKYEKIIVSLCTSPKTAKTETDIYGFDVILDAIELLPENKGMAIVLVDTNNTYKERYSERIHSIESRKGVSIIYTDLDLNFSSLISQASMFIRASRSDGDSIAVREALQNATPVLASDCVQRPNGCILFRCGDPRRLADQITALLADKERRCFDQEDFSEKIFQIYLE